MISCCTSSRKGNSICGPSGQQETLAGQSSNLSSLLSANYSQNFGAQSKILGDLTNLYTPIAEAGPDQQGIGANELAALNTQAGEGVGNNFAKAQQQLNNTLAARGGGNEALPTGSEAQLRATLASEGAKQLSNEQLGITRANYAQGRQNWQQATTAGLNTLANEYNPNAIAGEATSANNSAFGQASQIQQMKNQKESAIAGGIASLAGSALTFGMGGIANLGAGESFGEGLGDFFKGGISGLSGGSQ